MNAFAAAFVAIVTAQDAQRRAALLTPCGRSLGRREARRLDGPAREAPPRLSECHCREGQRHECARD